MTITTFLSRSPEQVNWGPTLLGAGFLYRILSPTDWTSCAPSYIIFWHPPSSCGRHKSHSFNSSPVKVIFWYSSTGCTCYLHGCISYFDSPAGSDVNTQHIKLLLFLFRILQFINVKDILKLVFFKQSISDLKSEFSFSLASRHTKVKEPSLPYYFQISGCRTDGFIPFSSEK